MTLLREGVAAHAGAGTPFSDLRVRGRRVSTRAGRAGFRAVVCAVTQPHTQPSVLMLCSHCLEMSNNFCARALHFHFALGSANYLEGPGYEL